MWFEKRSLSSHNRLDPSRIHHECNQIRSLRRLFVRLENGPDVRISGDFLRVEFKQGNPRAC